MGKNKGITLALLLVLLLYIDAYVLSGVLTKSFYVPVVKGEYVEADEAEEPEDPEDPATPTNVFVIISAPIQIEVDEEIPGEDIEVEAPEVPQLGKKSNDA